jgi:hypothetical protein
MLGDLEHGYSGHHDHATWGGEHGGCRVEDDDGPPFWIDDEGCRRDSGTNQPMPELGTSLNLPSPSIAGDRVDLTSLDDSLL